MSGVLIENIVCTAGTKEKQQYLHEQFNLIHVFNSRDLSFIQGVRKTFPQEESIKLPATNGHFIEIGKRDIYSQKTNDLLLYQLRFGCSFHIIDLVSYCSTQPKLIQQILREILQQFEEGQLHIYEPSQIIDAFHISDRAEHIGKLAVRIRGTDELLRVEEEQTNHQLFTPLICNNGTILISGGTGGLGIEMSKWMIMERQVKRIILMARQTKEEFEQSNSYQLKDWLDLKNLIKTKYRNVNVEIRKCDVTQYDQILNLVKELHQTEFPIRSIIHAALVLEDSLIQNMIKEQLIKAMRPKIWGAWNLHQAANVTQSLIHFFLLFSSLRNHSFSQLGASAYNAANQYLESLAYWRYNYAQQPALATSLPGITQVGFFHQQRKTSAMSKYLMKGDAINMFFLPPTITFELIENLFINQQQQKSYSTSIIFALNWSIVYSKLDHLQYILLEDLIKRKYVQLELEHQDESPEFKTSINTMTIETIISKICSAVGEIFGSSNIDRIDINKSLNQQGMDSLMAVALRNWLEKELLISIPLSELFQGIAIQYLSQTILTKLNEGLTTTKPLTTATDENQIITIAATTEVNDNQIQTHDMINNKDDEYTNLSLMHCLYQEKIIMNNNSSHKPI